MIERARGRCEYCHKPQISFFPHEVDHVVALKRSGATTLENLAFACFQCNRYKGSDLSSIDPHTGAITPLFNPRTQLWTEHFRFDGATITPLTPEGRATSVPVAPERPRTDAGARCVESGRVEVWQLPSKSST
ncbi:MAG: HNH endonuclease [Anaerolineae bacterium]